MATRATDATALESLLVAALAASDRLNTDHVGAHIAMALDTLRRQASRPHRGGGQAELEDVRL